MPNSVEQKAMEIVMRYEKSLGRKPMDVSKTKHGFNINSEKRCIEVKCNFLLLIF